MDAVALWADNLRAKNMLFALDSCLSGLAGVLDRGAEECSKFPPTLTAEGKTAFIRSFPRGTGRHLLTAGTQAQRSVEADDWQGSLYFIHQRHRLVRAQAIHPWHAVALSTPTSGMVRRWAT